MDKERTRNTRFQREKAKGYRPKEGSWESVLVGIKEFLPEDVFGVADGDFWQPIEEKQTMSLKDSVFQYYLAGRGHKTLATMIVNSFPNVRTAVALGTILPVEKNRMIGVLSDRLFDAYPEKYKQKINK
ncbi:MAG: hypothetical protein UU16_C0022G0036 [Candidatus Woesebacteria bacterium GW2011_GWA2_40_7]|uniref:Uncharacterized protein n=3 Tax=Candidatus Woeseibacteriota TaxID=1752722 RepID=A0A0G0X716_9BACT|nr:MAG: hypothetical protein UT17_C0002G0194 [Candidatus Woesebacteria bacterium GW2011_GWB1_39_10]KKR73414.1 MAG: hypothetical protein UU16_C0022G0036 [Candidatus Woesebacteria bacterium GW2011_GWA2_40_7]KKR92455.1 MAG: hypothetical protein UU42_C0001G0059 [Candidatus Woesebacteria bacterium GW2011_GWA1_41_13b]